MQTKLHVKKKKEKKKKAFIPYFPSHYVPRFLSLSN